LKKKHTKESCEKKKKKVSFYFFKLITKKNIRIKNRTKNIYTYINIHGSTRALRSVQKSNPGTKTGMLFTVRILTKLAPAKQNL